MISRKEKDFAFMGGNIVVATIRFVWNFLGKYSVSHLNITLKKFKSEILPCLCKFGQNY